MSLQHRDQRMDPADTGAADDTRAPQTAVTPLETAPASRGALGSPADAQAAALIRTLARIIRRQCTVPARTEEGPQP
jgi:hypothetical protein